MLLALLFITYCKNWNLLKLHLDNGIQLKAALIKCWRKRDNITANFTWKLLESPNDVECIHAYKQGVEELRYNLYLHAINVIQRNKYKRLVHVNKNSSFFHSNMKSWNSPEKKQHNLLMNRDNSYTQLVPF